MSAESSPRSLSRHEATVVWSLREAAGNFRTGRYSRAHTWTFDGGVTIAGSPSPHVVKAPWSDARAVDPEEAFVAAIASCHMLTFLWLAGQQGWVCTAYQDTAIGTMTRNEAGIPWVSEVRLQPRIQWESANVPSAERVKQLHEEAHQQCFIANSVRTTIRVVDGE